MTEGSNEGVRLQKALADAGIASRRASEELISAGKVTVNRRPARLGQRIRPSKDIVEVDGVRVQVDPDKEYLMVNKPEGYVTTVKDPEGRKTVMDLIGSDSRLFPVGRLDIGTEGLLLITNDGDLAHKLTHPSFGVDKTYVVEVRGWVDRKTMDQLRKGVRIDRGRPAVASSVKALSSTRGKNPATAMEIVVHEGRKHVVKKMCEEIGHPVKRLVRVGFGPLRIGRLAPGTYRKLTPKEVTSLHEAVGLSTK